VSPSIQANYPRVMTKPKPPSQNGNLEYVQKNAIVKHKEIIQNCHCQH